ncbi:heat shock factor protein 5-like isoform X1 [Pipra filicauda]|uniref:Heat shock factor protein 5-like isoform X1 n=1 Tax=Pipra filicauda TaxID=649802 RepID=A0A6J2FR79_9PASS|nr:heat shock factor protein 5-like isoform X1 [Pipra filicauda]
MAEPLLPAGFRSGSTALWPYLFPAASRPCTFPAKLWLLVNNPRVRSVRWDARGEGLFIDQALFERELLGGGPGAAGEAEVFKTKNFGSIIRQLNLYGFHKLTMGPPGPALGQRLGPAAAGDSPDSPDGPRHHFWNPHFRHNRPDLLVRIKRLTKANKEKLDAGMKVPSRLLDDLQHIVGKGLVPVALDPRRVQRERVPIDYSTSRDLKLIYMPNCR